MNLNATLDSVKNDFDIKGDLAGTQQSYPLSPKVRSTQERVLGTTSYGSSASKTSSTFPRTTTQEMHSNE
jgi:hypothetical protein